MNISCKYLSIGSGENHKHFCQGKDPRECLEQGELSEDRISLEDNAAERAFTVTISNLRAEDAGIYWCVEFIERGPTLTSAIQLTVRRGENQQCLSVSSVKIGLCRDLRWIPD